jgi:two-component system alkaline phosphatase synthesis response regulator PhoP
LLARINAVLSRLHENTPIVTKHILTYYNLTMNLKNMQVMLDGIEIHFTKKEFEILRLFLENKNRLYTRQELLSLVWPEESYVLNRTIDVNINRIRKKTGQYGKNITTKLGLGYCFEE